MTLPVEISGMAASPEYVQLCIIGCMHWFQRRKILNRN